MIQDGAHGSIEILILIPEKVHILMKVVTYLVKNGHFVLLHHLKEWIIWLFRRERSDDVVNIFFFQINKAHI